MPDGVAHGESLLHRLGTDGRHQTVHDPPNARCRVGDADGHGRHGWISWVAEGVVGQRDLDDDEWGQRIRPGEDAGEQGTVEVVLVIHRVSLSASSAGGVIVRPARPHRGGP